MNEPQTNEHRSTAAEWLVAIAFTVSILAGLALGGVYWAGGQSQAEGVLLALSLGGIGIGMVGWAKRFLPEEEVTEARSPLPSEESEVAAFTADFERGEEAIGRRRVLVRLLLGAVGALGVAVLFPIRSLGPRPGRGLFHTAFGRGVRLVDDRNSPVRATELNPDSIITVWPEDHVGAADSPALLINAGVDGNGTVDGIVAYSKLCTHTGCPVGLYQREEKLLLCPCHQSTFDVRDGARPIFGPATRSLPQLPLDIDEDGHLVASGDFSEPTGAGFWDRPDT